ncbi:hypothetical protein AMJ86_08770 [bacterium SM23_57]|nr:MAG: hypothetical protein AMJ86_08770 [bacterium SM23_57]
MAFSLAPKWSAVIILGSIVGFLFIIASITNPRWPLGIILIFTPMKFLSVPIASYHINATYLLIAVLTFILYTKGSITGRYIWTKSPLDKWFAILLSFAIINSIFSRYAFNTSKMWFYFIITGPLLFLLVHHHFTQGVHIRKGVTLVIIAICAIGLTNMIEIIVTHKPLQFLLFSEIAGQPVPQVYEYRAQSFTNNAVIIGMGFSIVFPFAIFGLQHAANKTNRLIWSLISLILILGALATFSRGTLLAMLVSLLFLLFRKKRLILIGGIGLILLAVVISQTTVFELLLIRLDPRYLMNDPSLWHRLLMFWSCWRIFLEEPLIGAGLESIKAIYNDYRHPLDILRVTVVDNQFLSLVYGTGIVGLIIVFGLFVKIFKHLLRYRWHKQIPIAKSFRWAGTISVLAFCINSLTFDSFMWAYSNVFFWFTTALLIKFTSLPHDQITAFFRLYGYKEDSPELALNKNPES